MDVDQGSGGSTDMAVALRQPLTLRCGQVLNNRVVKAAMSEQLGNVSNQPTDRLLSLYEQFGASGAGLLITGNVMIDRRQLAEPLNVVLEDNSALESFKRWAQVAKAGGAKAWLQLNHPGRQVPRLLADHPLAPSAVAMSSVGPFFGRPIAMTEDDISEVLVRFGRSAQIAQAAGFDGVELHGAHGYLINQFLSPAVNQRTDSWGGSLENRMRFVLQAVREVRRATSGDFAVGIKINSNDFMRGGFDQTAALKAARALDAEGVDMIEISGGTYERAAMFGYGRDGGSAREAYFAEFAREVTRGVDAAVMLTGGNRTAAAMAQAIVSDECDLIGVARPMAIDPQTPRLLLSGGDGMNTRGPRRTGIHMIDAYVITVWHERQLRRRASGKSSIGRFSVVGSALWGARKHLAGSIGVRRARRLAGITWR
ncbi:MAG: NADH:flavin oxidoreductase/NADH oxidase family protein [Thermoleophilaceae bacterium]|nr:NADH:flavin oxidoreductase/NADH oxidase family protein [Thermoleophilaceae bacterium]